ncbi:WD40 repeat domain-containing protein [Streptomyces sp. WM6378]|uniref:WD40 repeat domain-containing protein n=1 Tax=Streptomyces sp. WM6378 TaxID=1415557 RepID=UPI0006AFB7D0|nr:hypothetical protein [Streptomyces sp. WM6378]KOU54205.1 hypothetical protein ADK54_02315 [Streptomyces sp. WM6378]
MRGDDNAQEHRLEDEGAGDQAVHARIAAALARMARAGEGLPPAPYVRRHLARHAHLGGVLDDARVPPDVLAWDTSGSVRGLLGADPAPGRRSWLSAWAVVEPYLQDADLASRLGSLHLAYAALHHPRVPGARMPPNAAAPADSPLAVLWAQWSPPSNVLATVTDPVTSLTAVPQHGGVLLAVGGRHGTIAFLDALTGRRIGEALTAHDGEIRSLRTSVADSTGHRFLVSGSTDGSVRIWDALRGSLYDQIQHSEAVWTDDCACYFADDGALCVVSVNGRGELARWTAGSAGAAPAARRVLATVEPVLRAAVTTLVDESGQRRLVLAAGSLSVRAESGSVITDFPLDNPVRALVAGSEPGRFYCGHADGALTAWDVRDGQQAVLAGHGPPVVGLTAVTVGGCEVIAAGRGTTICLWDPVDGRTGDLGGHQGTVAAVAGFGIAGCDGLASAAGDDTVRLWPQAVLQQRLEGGDYVANGPRTAAAAFTTGGGRALVAAAEEGGPIEVRDITSGSRIACVTAEPAPAAAAMTWACWPGGRLLMWAGTDHTVRGWDALGERAWPHVLPCGRHPVRALATCTTLDGPLLLTGGDDWRVRLWDLSTAALLHEWPGHRMSVRAVAAAVDVAGRTWLASAGAEGLVRLWNTGTQSVGTAAPGPLRCAQGVINALSINALPAPGLSTHLVSGGDTGTLRFWDLATGEPLGAPVPGHRSPIDAVTTWTAGGQSYAASASRDGMIRIWEASAQRCVLQLATATPVRSLSAHPRPGGDGTVLALSGEAGAAVIDLAPDPRSSPHGR